MEAKKCRNCDKVLPLTSFYKDKTSYRTKCKECHKEQVNQNRESDLSADTLRYRNRRDKIWAYKVKCELCDFDKHPSALDFHHRDPATKSFIISSGNIHKDWDLIEKEINKCAVLCATCHRLVHAGVLHL